MKKYLLLIMLLILVSGASATQLGMNYYHETMLTKEGWHYVPRTTNQVSSDMDSIKSITNYVKLYSNPMISNNQGWVDQVNTIAQNKGMYTVIVMNTEDRIIDYSNWYTYATNVINNCKFFNNKADEFVVGNELSLHSNIPSFELKTRVESLINSCKQYLSQPVSYEAFWYEKDSWNGYNGKLYFNMYENLGSYTTNIQEMRTKFPNANIGEFGEDLYDGNTLKDENWQKQEVQKRWDIVKNNNVPVAYVFSYKEPSFTGFGLVRSDESKRPSWNVFGTATITPPPTTTPPSGITLPVGTCNGNTEYKICDKGSNTYEIYFLSGSKTWCYQNYCVSPSNGYVRFTATGTPPPVITPPTTNILPVGGCNTQSSSGTTVLLCDKGSGWYEMYLQTFSGTNYCYKTSCVGANTGFARFQK
jgi:hypothetical protein